MKGDTGSLDYSSNGFPGLPCNEDENVLGVHNGPLF